MPFENIYPNRKDWRKSYHDSRDYDRYCRSHGLCKWCSLGRLHRNERRNIDAALRDIELNGTVRWEDLKRAIGL